MHQRDENAGHGAEPESVITGTDAEQAAKRQQRNLNHEQDAKNGAAAAQQPFRRFPPGDRFVGR